MLGIGGFTPLEGFMTHADWEGVCARYQTASGVFWPIPITLSSHEPVSGEVALIDAENGETLATMNVVESYKIDKQRECQAVFRTTDAAHLGVAMVMGQGDYNLAGPVKVLSEGGFKAKYGALFMTPAQTRAEFERLGWSRVAAFQTRNPMQRAHEYLVKTAIEVCDGVLVHSLLGNLKPGDIPAEVRARAIAVLIQEYFRPGTVVQAGYPLDIALRRSARGAAARALSENYGCSHLIVGRDHAGVESTTDRSTRTASSMRSRRTHSRSSRCAWT